MFIISNINSGIKSSLKKLDKPFIKINKLINRTGFTKNSNDVFSTSQDTVKRSIYSSKNEPQLTSSAKFIKSLFSRDKKLNYNSIHSYKDYTQPLLPNNYKSVSHAFNALNLESHCRLISPQAGHKIDYRYESKDNLHKVYYFSPQNNSSQSKINFLLANFFNSNSSAKLRKAIHNVSHKYLNIQDSEKHFNFNHQEFLSGLDNQKNNIISVENINLIDDNFILELAKNRQRLMVSNGKNIYVFIPRLEFNQSTKSLDVYWHYIDENANLVYEYENLNKAQKAAHLKNNIINSYHKDLSNSSKQSTDIYAEINFLQAQNRQSKKDIESLKNQYKQNNNQKNIAFSNTIIDLEQNINQIFDKINQLKQQYDNLRIVHNQHLKDYAKFSHDISKIIDILIKHNFNYSAAAKPLTGKLGKFIQSLGLQAYFDKNAIAYVEFFLSNFNHNNHFLLKDLLQLIKSKGKNLTLVSSPPLSKGPFHALFDLTKAKPNLHDLQNKLQQKFVQNNQNKDLVYAVSKIYNKTPEQFIRNNPQAGSELLADNIDLTHTLNQANEKNGEVFDLNMVFKYKDIIDHSAQKNGKSIIDNIILRNIKDKKPFLFNLNAKSGKNSAQLLLEFNQKENIWQLYNVNSQTLVLNFSNDKPQQILAYLEQLTREYKVSAYLQINHNKTRAEYRFKGYNPLGSTTHKLFNKLLKHHQSWDDDIITDKKSTFFQLKDKYSLAPANLAKSSQNFADKNIQQYSRAEQALIYKWHAREIRADHIGYKQEAKAGKSRVTRFVTSYLNPFSHENLQGWKAGRYERLAKMNREDRAKRIKGNAVENGWQSIDNWWAFIINSIARGADSEAFKDGTTNWLIHMATCTQSQLMGDALGATSMHSKSKNTALASGLTNTTNDLSRKIHTAVKKNEADFALFENIYEQSSGAAHKKELFSIDGKNYNKAEAQQKMQHILFENMVVFQDLLWQHKAQNKSVVGIAFFKQLFQNLVRMGFMVANAFLPGVSVPLSKLTRLFRMIFQFIGAGADGLLGDEYLLRTSVNMPGHQMTKEAIRYNLDHIIDNLNKEDFEKYVIGIMIKYGHTPYTAQQIEALPEIQKNLLLSKFVFSADAIHNDINYNADGRVNQGKTYFQETFADYDARFKKYKHELKLAQKQHNNKSQQIILDKLDVLKIKEKDKVDQAALFYRGLAYVQNKNSKKYAHEEWKYAWQTLAKKYPKSKIVDLLRTDNPFPVIGYAFKNLMKNPMEVLHHTFFRAAFLFWGIDEIGYSLSSAIEKNDGDDTAQKIASATWYSYVFVAATIGGVASYLEHIGTNGRPANHKSNIAAFILELQQVISKFNQKVNVLKQQLQQNNLTEKQKNKLKDKIHELDNSITPLNKVIELLMNDINPHNSIKNISDAEKLLITSVDENSRQHQIIHKNINKSVLEQYTSELLASSVASILPQKPQQDKKQTDKNWIENIQKNADFWIRGESIFSYPLNKAQGLFKSKQKQQLELTQSLDKAKQQLLNYTQNIFAKYKGDYFNALNYLFSQVGHEVNKSLFIQQIIDIKNQTDSEISLLNSLENDIKQTIAQKNAKPVKSALDNHELYELRNQLALIKLKQDNFRHLLYDTNKFLQNKYNNVLAREKYLDISNNAQAQLFEQHDRPQIQNNNQENLISFKLDSTLNFNNRRLDSDFETAETTAQKIKMGSKRTGKFLYERIFNPFGRKSLSKYLINPSYRHWIPYMLARQAIILPVKLVEFSVLSGKSGSLKHSLQKTSNHSAFRNITDKDITNLDVQLVQKDQEIQNSYNNANRSNLSQDERKKAQNEYYSLHKQKQQLEEQREKNIAFGYQVWRANDSLKNELSHQMNKLLRKFNLNKQPASHSIPTFNQNVQKVISDRRQLIGAY